MIPFYDIIFLMQKYSQLFGKTNKESKEFDSLNATLLQKAGFISQEMSGVYLFLPLGKKVLDKIENIIRDEMLKISQEVILSNLSSKDKWEKTERINIDILLKAIGANKDSFNRNDTEYILNPSHEEVITPLAKEMNVSYKDFPFALFQIQTKFRNEARSKSGLLRGREFRMKDLYSFHTSEKDLKNYYEKVKISYFNIFEKLGLKDYTIIAKASGGDFTNNFSEEFQILCENGEDTIYFDEKNDIYYNKEIAPQNILHNGKKASEAGNIFILKDKYTKIFDYKFKDKSNEENYVYMGCYGIGTTRVMGIIAEIFNDDKGLIWPESISPYDIHLIGNNDSQTKKIIKIIEENKLSVLWDERENVGIGEKLKDADLIGVPKRIIISERSLENGGVEIKRRNEELGKIVEISDLANYL